MDIKELRALTNQLYLTQKTHVNARKLFNFEKAENSLEMQENLYLLTERYQDEQARNITNKMIELGFQPYITPVPYFDYYKENKVDYLGFAKTVVPKNSDKTVFPFPDEILALKETSPTLSYLIEACEKKFGGIPLCTLNNNFTIFAELKGYYFERMPEPYMFSLQFSVSAEIQKRGEEEWVSLPITFDITPNNFVNFEQEVTDYLKRSLASWLMTALLFGE